MSIETESPRRPRWVYAPLFALAIISFAPIFAELCWILLRFDPGLYGLGGAIYASFTIAAINWPLLALYFATVSKINKEWPSLTSVRRAMWSSLVAMAIPNVYILLGFAVLALEGPRVSGRSDVGPIKEIAFLTGVEIFVLPILGVGGWFFGRSTMPRQKGGP